MKITIEGENRNGLSFDASCIIDDQVLRMSIRPTDFIIGQMNDILQDAIDKTINDYTPMPKSIASEKLLLGNIEIIVHQLDNGERVIDAEAMPRLLEGVDTGEFSKEHQATLIEALGGE